MTQAYHTLVVGDSGSGKTTLMRQIHAEFGTPDSHPSVWVNHSDEANVAGTRARSPGALKAAVNQHDARDLRVNYTPTANARAATATARNWALSLREYSGEPVQVVVDEADAALPDSEQKSGPDSDNQLREGLHNDRDAKVKYVLGTQDPMDLYYPPIKQCRYIIWVGVPSPFHRGFADYFNLDKSSMPTSEYEYVIFAKKRPFEWTEVHRDETQERFAV